MNMFNSHALYITYTVLNMYPLQVIGLALFVFSIIEGQMSCIQAQSQLSKGAPATCNDVLASGDIFNMRDEKITTFCVDNDCPKILLPIYKSIAEACGGGGVPSDPSDPYATLLQESCWKYNESDCLTLWKIYIYPVETGINTTFTAAYNRCVQDYAKSRTNCTDNCKSVLGDVINDLGCCYDAIEKIGFPFIGADMVQLCQLTVPDCTTKKEN